ncbi:MAG: IclR family transcriptional regulator [Peptococcaceae bacterium]|nr:IclR family transcriptional regulator [Peptococcaceae bacterium]
MSNKSSSEHFRSSHVQSLARALHLIEVMTDFKQEISVTDLSNKLGWPKSTTYGILSTLRDYRYIDQSPTTGRYKIGVRFFEIGNIVSRTWDIRNVAVPHMLKLNAIIGEIVQLATEDHGDVLYLEKVDTTKTLNIVSEPGDRLPMHCSGLGKVLLAYRNSAEINYILSHKGMPAKTPQTITDPAELKKQLELIRQQNLAIDDREIMDDICCVASPIFDNEGKVKFALSVSGKLNNMHGPKRELIISSLVQCTRAISEDMGYVFG